MNIFDNLPEELKNKIKYYTIEHPCAVMIKNKIEEFNCHLYFKFKNKQTGKVFCKLDGRDYFCGEYFNHVKKNIFNYEYDSDSDSSVNSELFHNMFDVMSQTSSDSCDDGY